MAKKDEPSKRLDQFSRDVLYDALVGVTSKVLGWAAMLVVALIIALVAAGLEVPAWTLAAMTLVALVLTYLTRRVVGREARELRFKLNSANDKLDRHDSYGSNLCSVLDTFQKINAKDIENLTMSGFIERGILIPARDVMQENGHPSDLRISVLQVEAGHFSMIWASGHSVESQTKYRVPIDQTISRVAYEKKAIQIWKNAPVEERGFVRNPKAKRGFKSMVSIPILVGEDTLGVFNAVTDQADAFDPADVNYLTSLGSIIQLAFGMAVQELEAEQAERSRQGADPAVVRLAKKRLINLPRNAPESGVRSSDTVDGMEVSDE